MFGIKELLIILLIILLLFGTKKLRNLGSDLGGAVANFKKSVKNEKDSESDSLQETTLK